MATPHSRTEFKEYCLRALGAPILEINVTDEQVEDAVDYTLKMFADYHFDGSDKIFYKYLITANNRPDKVYDLNIVNGGTGYANTDTLVFTAGQGADAAATLTTDANGTIISTTMTNHGGVYAVAPAVTITTSTGTGASVTSELGGFVPVPQNVMGVINIFEPGGAFGAGSSLFNVRYQLVMSELYNLAGGQSLIPYYMTMTHIALLEELLVGKTPIRYNRKKGKLYLDTDWWSITDNTWLVAEAYEILDPEEYTSVWGDRWLSQYCIQKIKYQWGSNIGNKFVGMQMLGGMQYNGPQLKEEAYAKLEELEHELINSYSLPASDMIG